METCTEYRDDMGEEACCLRERVLYILTEELGADYDEALDLVDDDFETALWIAREAME